MPDLTPAPAVSSFRLNLQIVSVVMFNFASYMTIGLPLAVLPGYVHDVMGYSAFWAGLVISLQYFATLLSRPHAGRYADILGPKKIVIFGLCGCFLSGASYMLAAFGSAWPLVSLVLLCFGRVILGIGQSFAGTGSTLWGVGVVGSLHIGRVISWNGIVTYGAMAMGAPLGVLIYHFGRLELLAGMVMAVALVAVLLALPRPAVKASKSKPLPFRAVLGRVWPYGMALALASAGFGVIATFITLFYDAKGWDGAAFALTLFSCAFVGTRLLFPNGINRFGGLNVAMICFSVEIIGLLLVGFAVVPWMAKAGTFLTGAGFSLVFPALGVVAVKRVPQQNQGSALATYTVFMDLSLGITGPLAGFMMAYAGVSMIYLAAAALVFIALLMAWKLKKRPPIEQPEAMSSSQQ
ncbi:MFS transporter [Buttiauxella sp. WJP83]|uniref:MFS transporter n=1 Tax=Buttiauxella sp. WJP83 TaxID=2986951 RepID=UPI0022DE6759|nr:MFS transporter [Buttiauxella sp. WJP83]WBM70774.1 MFS transporter [Buttiauxella sp. WJP83]